MIGRSKPELEAVVEPSAPAAEQNLLTSPLPSRKYSNPRQSKHPLPALWHSTWWLYRGRRGRNNATKSVRLPQRARVMVLPGADAPPSIAVQQHSAREWTIRITVPADWESRIFAAGLARYTIPAWRAATGSRQRHPAKPGILLDYVDRDGWRELHVLIRPNPRHNKWAVVVTTVPLPASQPAESAAPPGPGESAPT